MPAERGRSFLIFARDVDGLTAVMSCERAPCRMPKVVGREAEIPDPPDARRSLPDPMSSYLADLLAAYPEQQKTRHSLVDAMVESSPSFGIQALRWSFLAFPPLDLLVAENNEEYASAVIRRAGRFNRRMLKMTRRGVRDTVEHIETSLVNHAAHASRHNAWNYRDIAVFWGQSLGPVVLLVRTDGVDWERVHDVERAAFAGDYRSTLWWPEIWPEHLPSMIRELLAGLSTGEIERDGWTWHRFREFFAEHPEAVEHLKTIDADLSRAVETEFLQGRH